MAVIPIEDPAKKGPPKKSALWALGFRPFFLLAGIAALALVAVWAMVFAAGRPITTYYGYIGWHSHEMVFGYAVAAVAGFLLTATRNWTGR
ncbi:MAG TPA: NnrS family protein, partial [Gammaproteobacteria bacterium]|nr:NnrS family protein [Gammaproteobacteria bacterium]